MTDLKYKKISSNQRFIKNNNLTVFVKILDNFISKRYKLQAFSFVCTTQLI